jgi:hypothetical protein
MATTNKFIVPRVVTLPTAVSITTTTTNTPITGLSFYVVAGQTYKFKFVVNYTCAATSAGSAWAVNGPAATAIAYQVTQATSASATLVTTSVGVIGAASSPGTGNAVGTNGNIAILEGVVTPSASGTLILNGIKNASSTITVNATYSSCEWSRIDWPAAP